MDKTFSSEQEQHSNTVSDKDVHAPRPKSHTKCRNCAYPRNSDKVRCNVPDNQICWSVPYPEYSPVDYTAPSVAGKPVWADVDYKKEDTPQDAWNELDGEVDRRSHMGKYEIIDKLPRNPVGRTGLCSRGSLGRWGPNHAADPIVTRWKRDSSGNKVMQNNKPVLQFIAIQRKDTKEWAIPGGMVEAGKSVPLTLEREFGEETMNSLQATGDEKKRIYDQVTEMFQHGTEVYRGYVDDPRNTDNSWMETVAFNFHDESGENVGRFKLNAGDDAVGVQWSDIDSGLSLYASHIDFISQVAKIHEAYW